MKLNLTPKTLLAVLDYLDGVKYGDKVTLTQKSVTYDRKTMNQEEFEQRLDKARDYFKKLLHHRSK